MDDKPLLNSTRHLISKVPHALYSLLYLQSPQDDIKFRHNGSNFAASNVRFDYLQKIIQHRACDMVVLIEVLRYSNIILVMKLMSAMSVRMHP